MLLTRSDVLYILSLTIVLLAHRCNAQSPCPNVFEYKNDETGFYGIIHVYPQEQATSITTMVNFTIAARLTSSYIGKLEPIGENLALIQQFRRGEPINYNLHFPVISPVPRITAIVVNNNMICSGPPDSPSPHHYVTIVGLQHTLFLKNDGASPPIHSSPLSPQPRPSNQPVFIKVNGLDFPIFSFENTDTPVRTSNSPPHFIINNSQTAAGDKGASFDFSSIFTTQTTKPPVYIERPRQTTRPLPTMPQTTRTTIRTTTTTTTPRPQPVDKDECGVNGNDNLPLIYNGMSYNRGDWPWLVAIFKRKDISVSYICSGTLVSDRHVITAAHCMHRKTSLTSINDIVVKAGVYNILDWGDDDVTVSRKLAAATIHESYNASTLANDILLLTFTRPVEFNSYIKPACLWSGNTDLALIVGASGVVTGWGVSEIGPAGKGEPRMVRMPIVSTATCRASKPDFHKLTSSKTLCAGDRNGAGPCLGDSGGGLYMVDNGRWKLRGIVSLSLVSQAGDMSCNLNDYIVFTDAAQYLTWIKSNMIESHG